MSWYAALHVGILCGLIALTWRYRTFWHEWPRLAKVGVLVTVPWMVLDAWQVSRGYWSYQHVWTWRPLGLPVEEIAFFVTVPLICLAVWHIIETTKLSNVLVATARYVVNIILFLLAILSFYVVLETLRGVWYERALLDALLFLVAYIAVVSTKVYANARFMVWNLLVLSFFLAANLYLTALPIVLYNDALMPPWPRVLTIPVADFWYNFSLLWMTWAVYNWKKSDHSAERGV